MEVGGRICVDFIAVDVDDGGAEEVLGVDVGNRCCEGDLDCWKAVEIGEIAGVVGGGAGREDLFLLGRLTT